MEEQSCGNCVYHEAQANYQRCRRYPTFEPHSGDQWCGEWRTKSKGKAFPGFDKHVVYDMESRIQGATEAQPEPVPVQRAQNTAFTGRRKSRAKKGK